MFARARNIYKATATMKAEKWDKKSFEGDEIGGKTLGVIGLGNIGKETARRAMALGMTVVAYDPYASPAEGVHKVALDELLAQADYISIHAPKTRETANMIGAEQFAKMKNGVRIVNCARGGIVVEDALYDALTRQGGRAHWMFRRRASHRWKLLSLTSDASPHIGAATKEAQARVGRSGRN